MNAMDYSPVFLRLRTGAFFCISIFGLLWTILLCFEIFFRWNITDQTERSLILAIVMANAITIVVLPILILREFRPWLDAARFSLLVMAHLATAVIFSCLNSRFECPSQVGDQEGVCQLITLYILIGSWIMPILLLMYSCGLALMVYRRTLMPPMDVESKLDDEEATMRHISSGNTSRRGSETWSKNMLEWLNTE